MTLCNMVIEGGGKNGIIEADETTFAYLRDRTTAPFNPVAPDPGASYITTKVYDARTIEPTVAQPHSPDRRATARDLRDVRLTRAYIGSCTGGKLTDFVNAAQIMRGRRVSVDTFLVPATTEISQAI